ncbi:MAG TPA: FHA domain-containing protein [Polyangia bacterium]|jgi:pSer/pThr/pTyr-binding forkhead associated (FHA) protein|nr:FHA domain-containing protein [Polyangia bacterium]
MAVKLRVLAGPPGAEPAPASERAVAVDESLREIRLGRRAGLEVELPFAALAPVHARLVHRAPGQWWVEDLGSATGSWLDGVALSPGLARAVVPGSVIRLAHLSVVFDGVGAASHAGEGTATLARRLVSDLFGARADGEVPRLIAAASWPAHLPPPPALRLAVPERPYLVGRGEDCDLVLPSDEVSREHAVLVRGWTGLHIRDLGSKNGVRVGGRLISAEQRLRDGDRVELGSLELRVDDPEDRYLAALQAAAEAGAAAGEGGVAGPGPPVPEPPPSDLQPAFPTARIAVIVAGVVLLAIVGVVVALVVG